jgi:hypothetical protein
MVSMRSSPTPNEGTAALEVVKDTDFAYRRIGVGGAPDRWCVIGHLRAVGGDRPGVGVRNA